MPRLAHAYRYINLNKLKRSDSVGLGSIFAASLNSPRAVFSVRDDATSRQVSKLHGQVRLGGTTEMTYA